MEFTYRCTKLEKNYHECRDQISMLNIALFPFMWVLAFKPSTYMLKSILQL